MAEWRDKNRERYNAYCRDYYQQNKEQHAVHVRNWMQANRERINELGRKRYYADHEKTKEMIRRKYQRNAEKLRIKQSIYKRNNPLLHRIREAVRRARANNSGGRFTKAEALQRFEQQGGRCYYCGCILEVYHLDHVVPLSRGGSNDISNIVCACVSCNLSKRAKLISEWGVTPALTLELHPQT